MSQYWENTNEFIVKSGWETRDMGDNLMVKVCPYCKDERWKLGISKARPVWICHHCEKNGNLRQLAEDIGLATGHIVQPMDKPYTKPEGVSETVKALRKFPTVIDYLKGKGLTGEIAARFKLGAERKYDNDWLVIPHYFKGEILNCKYRSTTGEKAFRRWRGGKSILFNSMAIQEKEVLITEGEMDCISVSAGYGDAYPVVGATGGAKHFDPEWIDLLSKTKKVYLCYDRDETGQIGAKDIARRLGYDRCWNILLPEGFNDLNDFYSYQPQDFVQRFDKIKSAARRFEIQGIQSAGSLVERVFATREIDKNSSPWKNLNRMVDIRPGHLVVVTADPKAGKTSLVLEWFRHRVNMFKEPTLFYCLDMKPDDLTLKIMQLEFDASKDQIMENRVEYKDQALLYFDETSNWYLCGKWWDKKEDYFKLIRAAIRRYGFKWVCFDHFHKLIESLNHTVQEQANLARDFKRLAEETETTVVLIAQPKKRGKGIMTSDDISGSGNLRAEADCIITLTRKRIDLDEEGHAEQSFEPEAFIRVDMTRWSPGGGTTLYFEGDTQKFTDPSEGDRIGEDNEEDEDEANPFT